jgi:hypothetical protein
MFRKRMARYVGHVVKDGAGDVGRQDETRGADAKQGMVRRRWLSAEDVEPRPAEASVVQGLGERDLVDDLAPGGIDDDRARPESRDPLSRQHSPRRRRVGNVKADDVGLGQEGVKLLESNAARLILHRGWAPDVEVVDLGVKR